MVADQGWGGARGVHAPEGGAVAPRIVGTPEAEEKKTRAGGSDKANGKGRGTGISSGYLPGGSVENLQS